MVLTLDKPHLHLPQTRSPLMNLYMNGGLNGAKYIIVNPMNNIITILLFYKL